MTLKEIITYLAIELDRKGFTPPWVPPKVKVSKLELYRYIEGHPEIASYSLNADDAEYASILASKVTNPYITINAVLNDPDGRELLK
jgi:hypothetical protein